MAPEKTEALLVTDRRSFQYPRIVLGEHEIEWKKSIKYLGVQNCLSIRNCVVERCAGPGERLTNRLIGGGKEGDLSAP